MQSGWWGSLEGVGLGCTGRLSEGVEVREVVRNEVDGPDGARAHVNSHVFLNAHPPLAHRRRARHGGPDMEGGLRGAPEDRR